MHADKHKCTYAHLTRYLKKNKKKPLLHYRLKNSEKVPIFKLLCVWNTGSSSCQWQLCLNNWSRCTARRSLSVCTTTSEPPLPTTNRTEHATRTLCVMLKYFQALKSVL